MKTQEADECGCQMMCVDDDAHARANVAQYEYFQQRHNYKKLSPQELVDTLKKYGVPDVLREVIVDALEK